MSSWRPPSVWQAYRPTRTWSEEGLFPPFSKIRETSAHIMAHLCQFFCDEGYGTKPQELRTGEEADWLQYVKKRMYNPSY